MKLPAPLRRLFNSPQERRYSITDLLHDIGPVLFGGELDPARVTQEAFRENPTVAAAINRVISAASQIPWVVQLEEADGERIDAPPDHPAVQLLKRPSPAYGWDRIVDAAIGNVDLFGESYFYLNGPGNPDAETDAQLGPPPLEVVWLPRRWIVRNPGDTWEAVRRVSIYTVEGSRKLPPHRLVYLTGWNPSSPWIGQARLRAAARSIDAANLARIWNNALLKNGARPSGNWVTDKTLDQTSYSRLKAQLLAQYTGPDAAGQPGLLEGGLTWQQNSMAPSEMEWTQGIHEAKREISTALGVDPALVGDAQTRTYANHNEGRKALYEDTILPALNSMRDAFEDKLRQWWPDLRLLLDSDKVPALMEAKHDAWGVLKDLVEAGLLTRNEARAEMGFDDVLGGDEIFVPIATTPLSEAAGAGGLNNDPEGGEASPSDAEDAGNQADTQGRARRRQTRMRRR